MKILMIMAFVFTCSTFSNAQAGICNNANEVLVSYQDDQSFCYLSAPLQGLESADQETLWEQTNKAMDELQQQVSSDKYKGSYKDLSRQLTTLYGNLDYAARASGHNFTGLGRSFFETAILEVERVRGPNAVNVKLAKIKNANNALAQAQGHVRAQTRANSCQPDYEKRIRQLAKKSVFGPAITGALTGTSATLAAGLYAMSLGPEFPLWLANLVGREVYKLPFATLAPVAGWIGLGIGTATLIGYEGIILAKIITMAQALHVVRDAKVGKVKKSFASKLGNFAKGRVVVRGWDPIKKEAILAQTITTMDSLAMGGVNRGLIEAGPFEEGVQICGTKLPHKKDLINFINENPDYLLAQLQPPSIKNLLANGGTTSELKIDGCKISGNILGLKTISEVGIKEEGVKRTASSEVWNQPIRMSANGGKLPKDLVKELKGCLVPARGSNIRKNVTINIKANDKNGEGRRYVTYEYATMDKKDDGRDDITMKVGGMTVTEEARTSYSSTEENIALGTKIQILQAGSQPDSAWENCGTGDFSTLPDAGHEVVMAHRKAIKEQSEANVARGTFAGRKLFWISHFARPDLKKWKRIVTMVAIDKNGQEEKTTSYEQCFAEEFQFPLFLSVPTGNIMEEVKLKPIRDEIKGLF